MLTRDQIDEELRETKVKKVESKTIEVKEIPLGLPSKPKQVKKPEFTQQTKTEEKEIESEEFVQEFFFNKGL